MEYEEDGDEDNINQEDCWEVISAYFEEKGLVRQQVLTQTPSLQDYSAPCPLASLAARFVRRLHLQPGTGNRG